MTKDAAVKPLEISFLAAGAVISLVAGGGAARLALIPLDDACAKGQAVADGFASAGPRVALPNPVGARAAVYPQDAPPPVAYALNDTPTPRRVRDGSARATADLGGARRPDRRDDSGDAEQDPPEVVAADYSGYAAAGPRFVEIGDRQDAGPSPESRYAARNPAAYSRDADDSGPTARYYPPPEPYAYPPPDPY